MTEAVSPGELIAQRVRKYRDQQNWSQRQLAERMTDLGFPINRVTLAKIEGGGVRAKNVSVEELFALAAALSVPPLALVLSLEEGSPLAVTRDIEINPLYALNWITGRTPFGRPNDQGQMIKDANTRVWNESQRPLRLCEQLNDLTRKASRAAARIGDMRPEVDQEARRAVDIQLAQVGQLLTTMRDEGMDVEGVLPRKWHERIEELTADQAGGES